jgi:hypothetical protein
LIGDKQHRIEMDVGDQLGRYLSFLDNGVKEEKEKEEGEEEEEEEEEEDSYAGHSIYLCPVVQCTNKRRQTQRVRKMYERLMVIPRSSSMMGDTAGL